MEFIYYDLTFLLLFCLFVGLFLYSRRKKIKVESKIFLLYRTKIGLRFISWASKTFRRALGVLSYFSITFGVFAMIMAFAMLFISIQMIFSLVTVPKVPPIMPLIPYLPQIFKLPLPPFYFTYWIIIILIIAVTHEFAHGIFASFYKIKIKATGFGFLGPFLAAFVEPDEKKMSRKSKKAQLAILSAGSFSNFIFAIIFLLLLQLFFLGCYSPAGVTGYMFAFQQVNVSSIEKIGIYSTEEFFNLSDEEFSAINKTLEVKTKKEINNEGDIFYMSPELLNQLKQIKTEKTQTIALYQNTPAFHANLSGALQRIGGFEIKNINDVQKAISSYNPNETIEIQTTEKNYTITLIENPTNKSIAYLGIGLPSIKGTNLFLYKLSAPFFSPFVYIKPKFNPQFLTFIRDLFLWLILISFSVALINMLPLGMLDGGKFIYLATFGITKSKKKSELVFKISAFLVLLLLVVLMLVWLLKI